MGWREYINKLNETLKYASFSPYFFSLSLMGHAPSTLLKQFYNFLCCTLMQIVELDLLKMSLPEKYGRILHEIIGNYKDIFLWINFYHKLNSLNICFNYRSIYTMTFQAFYQLTLGLLLSPSTTLTP